MVDSIRHEKRYNMVEKTNVAVEQPKTVEAALIVLLNRMNAQNEHGIFQDSIEIGTPSKNGSKLKIYGDFGKPAEYRRRINNALKIQAKFAPGD